MTAFVNPNAFGAQQAHHAIDDVAALLRRGQLFRYPDDSGPSAVESFEREAAHRLGTRGAVAVSSGTAGLRVALQALGVRPGDRVLIPAFTFIATAMAVVAAGAIPEPLDLAPDLGTDPDDLSVRLHDGVRCAVAVHVQGHAVDVEPIRPLLQVRGIPLLEDACQGFGARCRSVSAGAAGAAGVYSFQQSKQLASGEGGLVVSADEGVLERCFRLADLGAARRPDGMPSWDDGDAVLAENVRMTELQAVVLQSQLSQLDETLRGQQQTRAAVVESLDPGVRQFVVASADPDGDAASHLLLDLPNRETADLLIAAARGERVLVRRVWDRPYYDHDVFRRAGLRPEQLGVPPAQRAEAIAPRLVSVPTPAGIPAEDAALVATCLNRRLHTVGDAT
jgi:dTDP-4-amino-4,6-dideoxygalactose transaminase